MATYSNLISTQIPQEDLKEILGAIDFINRKLPELVVLSAEEKAALPKMKSNTIQFVHECLKLAKESPELVPKDVDVPEIKKDVDLVEGITKILIPLKLLMKKLKHSKMLAESEAYLPSLAIYNSNQHEIVKRQTKEEFKLKV